MKVIRIDDEETKLTKRQKQKIAILKLTENGKYIENIGIKDNEFFLLTEGDDDEQYLAFKQHRFIVNTGKTTQEEIIRLVKLMYTEDKIDKAKERLRARKESN
jgi:hypothetical protein